MGKTKRRFTVSVPPRISDSIDEMKAEYFPNASMSDMLAYLLRQGVYAVEAAAEQSKSIRNEEVVKNEEEPVS